MLVYVVFDQRFDNFEVYLNEPEWVEEFGIWVGSNFLKILQHHELPYGVARKAKHSYRAIECHAHLDIAFEVEEEEEE